MMTPTATPDKGAGMVLMTLKDLARRTDVPPRRIRWWIERGYVDKPILRGVYADQHVGQVLAQKRYEDMRVTREDVAERCRGNDPPTGQPTSATDS